MAGGLATFRTARSEGSERNTTRALALASLTGLPAITWKGYTSTESLSPAIVALVMTYPSSATQKPVPLRSLALMSTTDGTDCA